LIHKELKSFPKNFLWGSASAAYQVEGALDLIQESAACSSQQDVDVCAQSNAGPVQLFWSYTPSQPIGVNVAPPGSFIEMGIDVSAIFPGPIPCFTSFLVETRSSSQLNAQLKDFVAGQRRWQAKLKDFVPGQRNWQARRRGTHTLKVNNGRGSGRHVAGEVVKVTANTPPRGKKFAGWSGDIQILANPLLSTTTATMPSIDVRVSATYADVSQ
jgi:Divergent InlB B-repeat domain/Glycosyl hydrolase family 1